MTGEKYPLAAHCVYVSSKLYKVIVGNSKRAEPVLVTVRDSVTEQAVVSVLLPITDEISTHFDLSTTGVVHLPSNLFYTFFDGRAVSNLLVGVFDSIPTSTTSVFLSEVCGSVPYSDSVHRLALSTFFQTPRLLSTGETFAIPTWSAESSNEISEPTAAVSSWIGPGRAMDRRGLIHYKVTELKSGHSSVSHGRCDDFASVLLVGHRLSVRSIPRTDPLSSMEESLASWALSPSSGPCLLVCKKSANRVEKIRFLFERIGFFSHLVDSNLYKDNTTGLLDECPSCPILIFDNYEDINLSFFKNKKICLVEDFSLVKVPLQFSLLLDDSDSVDDTLFASYRKHSFAVESVLRKRLAGPSQPSVNCPKVLWDDIGGLEDAKKELRVLLTSTLRRGVLLFGPPGTGKTLLAKAIATEMHSSGFISVKGPELLSPYIGESEKNIRKIFETAKSFGRCVIFFDEIDSVAPSRGRASDSANVMDRVVASLLSELDGLDESVLLVGATNRPDLLDPALLRPGRIDRQVYVGIPADKKELLTALSRQFPLQEGVVAEIAPFIPRSMTGSDLAGLFRRAYLEAVKKLAKKNFIKKNHVSIKLSSTEIFAALKFVTPSVTEAELRDYELLRDSRNS